MHYVWLKLIFKCIYLFWERKRTSRRGAQRDRETEDPKQALCWQQRARLGVWTHELWDYDLSQNQMLNQLSHPDAPQTTTL